MSDQPGYVAPAGWYVEPKASLHLRWWSGLEWTEHIAPLPDVLPEPVEASRDAPPVTGAIVATAPLLETVQPSRRELRARSSSPATDDGPPLPPPVPRIAPVSRYDWDREAGASDGGPRGTLAPERVDEYRAIPSRWSTASVWLLAFTPWLIAVCALFVDPGFRSFPAYAAVLLPILITLAWAQRDVKRLHSWGHRNVPHWAWSLLGAPAYLVARTVVLRRNTGIGSAPMWVWLANLLVVAGTCVLLWISVIAPA